MVFMGYSVLLRNPVSKLLDYVVDYELELWRSCHWENPDNERYYCAELMQDLFGDWLVRRTWGRKGTKLGRMIDSHAPCYDEAYQILVQIAKRRKRRGYIPINEDAQQLCVTHYTESKK